MYLRLLDSNVISQPHTTKFADKTCSIASRLNNCVQNTLANTLLSWCKYTANNFLCNINNTAYFESENWNFKRIMILLMTNLLCWLQTWLFHGILEWTSKELWMCSSIPVLEFFCKLHCTYCFICYKFWHCKRKINFFFLDSM